jgi:hypothetical protein
MSINAQPLATNGNRQQQSAAHIPIIAASCDAPARKHVSGRLVIDAASREKDSKAQSWEAQTLN